MTIEAMLKEHKGIVVPAAVAVAAFAGWMYMGFPSPEAVPETLLNAFVGGDTCVNFAQEKAKQIGWQNMTVKAGDQWFKRGRVVVELIAQDKRDSDNMQSRLCVLGGGMVNLVSPFQAPAWY